jgi:hypothetical protein
MGAAELVIDAVSLAIAALQCYKNGKTVTDRVQAQEAH